MSDPNGWLQQWNKEDNDRQVEELKNVSMAKLVIILQYYVGLICASSIRPDSRSATTSICSVYGDKLPKFIASNWQPIRYKTVLNHAPWDTTFDEKSHFLSTS